MAGLLLAVAAVVVATVPGTVGAAAGPPAFVPGSGAASGSVARASLFYGGLTLPLGVGTSSASYTNSQSRALGVALDLGAYVGLITDVPPEFSPTVIDSNEGDRQANGNLDAGEAVARVELRATQQPAASSEVRMSDLDLPALVRVQGAHVRSATEVHEGRQRRAWTVVEISRVTIADLVVLEDLRWDAVHRSGDEPDASATFTVGGATIAGVPVPVAAGDVSDPLGALNGALLPVGLRIEAPQVSDGDDGTAAVGPLRVALADSEVGAQLLGPLLAGARPLLGPALDAAIDANSSLGLVGLVADIVLGVADGSGGVEVALGGATASTSSVGFVPPTIPSGSTAAPVGAPIPDPVASGSSSPIAGPASPSAPVASAAPESAAPTLVGSTSTRCVLEAAPRRQGGCRDGDVVIAIGISALAIAGVAAAEFGVRRRRVAEAVA